ncbi:MAG: glycoside hydrolase family 2 [Pirellulales bacterium]|nr:glycoside hydrolase family 2 [Pirellulales bacterium]
MSSRLLLFAAINVLLGAAVAPAQWQPVEGSLMTRWAKDVSPDNVHSEYPRPQMVRKDWKNLNGLWHYAIRPRDAARPDEFDGQILVPFPAESALSGVKKRVGPDQRLWYCRTFDVPEAWREGRVLLHFGAVDWEASVWVNGKPIGEHRGGYDPFTFDVTDALAPEGPQELVLAVWDPTDAGAQPRGKQILNPRGISYTAVTGIWQTVWLEPAPKRSIAALKIVADVDRRVVTVEVSANGAEDLAGATVAAVARDGQRVVAQAQGPAGQPLTLAIDEPRLWSPDDPHLYDLTVSLASSGQPLDRVESYFGMRKIAVGKDARGVNRLMLNDKPLFQYGFLDQGWWPDGLYTAPTDEALRYDLEMTKKIGMNLVRKHVKAEPARWYYHCDRLGVLVWQDMPSANGYVGTDDPDLTRPKEVSDQFRAELRALINARRNSPAIVMWVAFNEGWGQFDTRAITQWIKDYDPTRLVDSTSGWTDRGAGDVRDMHHYVGPDMPALEPGRAVVLGEFGGLGLALDGHLWKDIDNFGYVDLKNRDELKAAYGDLILKLRPLVEKGLSAAVYTQTTDVEGEVNGLMTYDRAVLKIDADVLQKMHEPLYQPTP